MTLAPNPQSTASDNNQPQQVEEISLAAVPTAVTCSRLFMTKTLIEWHLEHITNTVELIMSELVTNAVNTTGITAPNPKWTRIADVIMIHLRLQLLHDNNIAIEVKDNSTNPPIFGPATKKENHGYTFPPDGGKVVWCTLPIPPKAVCLPT